MALYEILTLIAILVGPVLAVQAQSYIERRREARERKNKIFKSLMMTRATPLAPLHVQSLNLIAVEFHTDKEVIKTWNELLDIFSNYPKDSNQQNYLAEYTVASNNAHDKLVDLLYAMAKVLNYNFEKIYLKRAAYLPKGHADDAAENAFLKRAIIDGLFTKKGIPVCITNLPEENVQQSNKEEIKISSHS